MSSGGRQVGRIHAGAPASVPAARARYFRVLGDPTRLRVLEALRDGEYTVAGLSASLSVPRSRLSNHLACLKWCRFVATRREGRHVLYRLADERVAKLIALAGDLSPERCGYLARCRRIGPDWI